MNLIKLYIIYLLHKIGVILSFKHGTPYHQEAVDKARAYYKGCHSAKNQLLLRHSQKVFNKELKSYREAKYVKTK